MAWGNMFSDELLDSLPEGGATVMTTEVVGPQYDANQELYNQMSSVGYKVPTVGSPNDYTPSGPYVREGNGVATRVSMNPALGAFPSLAQDDDNGMKAGQTHMRSLLKAQKLYASNLAARDPQAAGMAFADMDGMREGFNALVTEGWNGRDAAYTIGATMRTFGGAGNLTENAKQLKRFAETRGMDLTTAGNELWSLQKNFGAGYLSDYGYSGKVTPDSAHYENIRNNFTDILSALWKIEDEYNWQFNQATYQDVFNRCRGIAADLDLAGLSVKSIGAEAIVRSALRDNGSLRDDAKMRGDVTALMQSPMRDRGLLTLAPGFTEDTAGNPFRISGPTGNTKSEREEAAADSQDFGLVRYLRQALFRHRAQAVGQGRDVNDFSDTSVVREDFARAFRMFSTGSARVSDDTFLKLADAVLAGVKSGRQTSVVEAATKTAATLAGDQISALGQWSRALMMDTAEGNIRLREAVYPFIEQQAMATGLSPKDPAMAPFVAQAYRLARRAFLDRKTVAGLDKLTAEASDEELWEQVKQKLGPQLEKMNAIAEAKKEQAAARAAAIAEARERVKEEGN